MTLDTRNTPHPFPTVGIDATDLATFRDIKLNGDEMLVYDEAREDAWIQSDLWIDTADMS